MRTQISPSREELRGLCFFGDPCNVANSLAIWRAWERPVYMGDRELGKARVVVSSDYEEWRISRGMTEIMGAQMRALEEKEQESILTIDGLQRQCKKKDQEIEHLKDKCVDFNEETTKMMQQDLARTWSEAHWRWETTQRINRNLAELFCKERDRLAHYSQVLQERDRAIEKLDNLQTLVVHQEAKIKEAQKYNEDMS
ncbi:unnamed protein product [Sphenostylis stenocarpa]|uniref:Uncharacterized protein n=1 Tax=Sphenostylis stenocarpa TaxID=92480 RepID=A0AA86TFX5_9FABA|nr:unnamed protein product [Sphenostylis stenocarpa]